MGCMAHMTRWLAFYTHSTNSVLLMSKKMCHASIDLTHVNLAFTSCLNCHLLLMIPHVRKLSTFLNLVCGILNPWNSDQGIQNNIT